MAEAKKLPEGYGTAAPVYAKKESKGGAAEVTPKKGEKYIAFLGRCRKAGNSMGACAKLWKAGPGGETTETKKTRRRRAARIVRRKKRS